MKTPFIKYVCALSLILSPSTVLATGGTETLGTISVKDSSDSTNSQNSSGQMMSYLTGAKLFTESAQHFSKCPPHNPGQCVIGALKAIMGAMSMAQGGAHGGTAKGASLSSGLTNGADNFTPGYNDPYSQHTNSAYQAAKAALAQLEKGVAGSKIDVKKGTLTTYDGKTYDLNSGTPEGLAAAGFSPGAISGAMEYGSKIAKEMQSKVEKMKLGAMTASGGFDEGGGRGGSGSGSSADSSIGVAGGGGAKLERDPANLAGMQKNYNGEPIGVAADSIFLMMNRRYKVKESQDSFFSDAEIALQK